MTSPIDRRKALEILDEGMANRARARELALLLSVGLTTLQRRHKQIRESRVCVDRRKGSNRHVANRFGEEEHQQILLTCNKPDFATFPPGQIVPVIADRGLYIVSKNNIYRVLHPHGQDHRQRHARPPQKPRPVARPRAAGPNEVWGWDNTYLPTTVRGVWLYLYLVIDDWSRKIVAWDVAEREDPAIATDLVRSACLRERVCRGRKQPLILHTGNVKPQASRRVACSHAGAGWRNWACSRTRVCKDNPYSESLFRKAKYRPDCFSRPFANKGEACKWGAFKD